MIKKPYPGWNNEWGLKNLTRWVDEMTDGYNAHDEAIAKLIDIVEVNMKTLTKLTEQVDKMERIWREEDECIVEDLGELTKRVTALETYDDETYTEPNAFPDSAENAKGTEPIEPITGHWVCESCKKDWGDCRELLAGDFPSSNKLTFACFDCHDDAVKWVPSPAPSEIDQLRQRLETVEAELTEAYETREKLQAENKRLKRGQRETNDKLKEAYTDLATAQERIKRVRELADKVSGTWAKKEILAALDSDKE